MAAGVEMRVPYLDDGVFDVVARLPLDLLVRTDLGIKKYLLRHLALSRFGPDVLDMVLRKKLGVPASGAALHARFDRLCEAVLPHDYLQRHEFGFCFSRKRELLLFEMFHELFIEHRGCADSAGGLVDALEARAGSRGRRALLADHRASEAQ
jgi:asparagine synthase (glutamine-hydrolysing)